MISSKRKTKTTNKTNNKVWMKGILPLGPGAGGIGVLRDWGSSWGQIIPYPSISSIQKKKKIIPYSHQREAGLKVRGDKAYTGTGEV